MFLEPGVSFITLMWVYYTHIFANNGYVDKSVLVLWDWDFFVVRFMVTTTRTSMAPFLSLTLHVHGFYYQVSFDKPFLTKFSYQSTASADVAKRNPEQQSLWYDYISAYLSKWARWCISTEFHNSTLRWIHDSWAEYTSRAFRTCSPFKLRWDAST